jgi:hypothetical protein
MIELNVCKKLNIPLVTDQTDLLRSGLEPRSPNVQPCISSDTRQVLSENRVDIPGTSGDMTAWEAVV